MLTINILPLSDQPKSSTTTLNQSCRKNSMCHEQNEMYILLSLCNGETHFKFFGILTLLMEKAYITAIAAADFNKI